MTPDDGRSRRDGHPDGLQYSIRPSHVTTFDPLSHQEWSGPMTDRDRRLFTEGRAIGRQEGYAQAWVEAFAEYELRYGTVANRCETAARMFYAMTADEAHHKATGVWR